ncbi:MAG: GDP-mannose 4,6-dehydratase, partial [Pseudomonadota bacterium]
MFSRALVTGHTGFKGSWLCLWLARRGVSVSGLALDPPTEPSLFKLASIAKALDRDVRQDVRDREMVAKAIAGAAPEVVFHLAAQPLVRESYFSPVETFATNV